MPAPTSPAAFASVRSTVGEGEPGGLSLARGRTLPSGSENVDYKTGDLARRPRGKPSVFEWRGGRLKVVRRTTTSSRGSGCVSPTDVFPNLFFGDCIMKLQKQHVIGLAFSALFLATANNVVAQEQKPFSPALEQLRETVAERLQGAADKLGLTPEQRTKIKVAHTAFADKFETLRNQRREL